MYKAILAAVTVLSLNQAAFATERADIWNCVDSEAMLVNESCKASTIEKHTNSASFYDELAKKTFEPRSNTFAKVTYFPAQNLIQVQAIPTEIPVSEKALHTNLIAAKR